MKILRKDDDFVKMSDKSMEDVIKINSMVEKGWDFVPRKEYKDFYTTVKEDKKKIKDEIKEVKKVESKKLKKEKSEKITKKNKSKR